MSNGLLDPNAVVLPITTIPAPNQVWEAANWSSQGRWWCSTLAVAAMSVIAVIAHQFTVAPQDATS